MRAEIPMEKLRHCIVVAAGQQLGHTTDVARRRPPSSERAAIIEGGFLRQSLRRARRIASPNHVLLSAREDDRSIWAGPFWFVQAANRFVSERGVPTSLSTAAAVLAVAASSPSSLVTILPGECWVARESVLMGAIESALTALRAEPDAVGTLGMSDAHAGTEEDYLIVGPGNSHMGTVILGKADRPRPAVARRLLDGGALVASGILLGQAQAFAARIRGYWPQLAQELTVIADTERSAHDERRLSACECRHIARQLMSSSYLFPATFATRAFRVRGSGWCSCKRFNESPSASALGAAAASSSFRGIGTHYPNRC